MIDVEQPAPELDSVAAATEAADLQSDEIQSDGLQEQQPEDEIEEEYEGLKLRGKKDLLEEFKKGRMLHRDYTQKTQEVAEQRKAFESEREQYKAERQTDEQFEAEKYRFWSAQQRAQQLQQVDFSALRQANPDLAESLRDELAKLSAVLPSMGQALAHKAQARQLEAQQTSAKRANDAEQIVMREVKDWGPEKLSKFVEAGQKAGIQPEGVRQLLIQFPQAARFMNKALMYDQLLAQRMQKPKAEPPKPATRVGGSAAANTKPLSEIKDPREWQQERNRRLGRTT